MGGRVGKQVDDEDARQDQPDAKDRGQVQLLAEIGPADQRDEANAKAGPHGIHDAHGQHLQGQRQEVERDHEADGGHDRRDRLGELLRGLDGGRANGLGGDGDDEVDVMGGHGRLRR